MKYEALVSLIVFSAFGIWVMMLVGEIRSVHLNIALAGFMIGCMLVGRLMERDLKSQAGRTKLRGREVKR